VLGLVNPGFDQAGSRYIAVFIADPMRGAQGPGQLLVVGTKFCQHQLGAKVLMYSDETKRSGGARTLQRKGDAALDVDDGVLSS
jgi:hypothetical protein